MWLTSLVCLGPGRKPRRPVFSERGSYDIYVVCPIAVGVINIVFDLWQNMIERKVINLSKGYVVYCIVKALQLRSKERFGF